MTIWEQVEAALTPLGLPLAANAMILASEAARPDVYIVYFQLPSVPTLHADNKELERNHSVQVTYYDRAGLAGMPDIQGAMAAAGFKAGSQRELPYNPQTRHFGWAMDYSI